jgi:2-polyprenyl-3-methyl-5-hydroxy-6-metoxy-1,4-benzoquinol methylase
MKQNPMYTHYAKEYANVIRDNVYNAQFERPSLLSMLPDVKGLTVLDVGCGPGIYAAILVERGARVTAVDGSDDMIAIVQENLGNSVTAYSQNLEVGLPQEKDSIYDVVICPLMVHYLKDWSPLFQDVRRVLKDAGIFLFSTHHPIVDYQSSPSGNYFETELIEENWKTLDQPTAVSFYRRPLSAMFEAIDQAGFYVSKLSEGSPTPSLAQTNPTKFKQLSTKPTFLFFKCATKNNNHHPKIEQNS